MPSKEEENELGDLQQVLEECLSSFESAYEMLDSNKAMVTGETTHKLVDNKQYILDSFKVNRAVNSYKHWEREGIDQMINEDFVEYNKTKAELSRLDNEYSQFILENDGIRTSVKLPKFQFSYQSLKLVGDEELLARIEGEPELVDISDIYSVNPKDDLPFPEDAVIKQLINMEYRVRMEKRLRYEIAQGIKHQIISNNSKWNARDTAIEDFVSKKLPSVIKEVENTLGEIESSDSEEEEEEEDELEEEEREEEEIEEGEEEIEEIEADNESLHSQQDDRKLEDELVEVIQSDDMNDDIMEEEEGDANGARDADTYYESPAPVIDLDSDTEMHDE